MNMTMPGHFTAMDFIVGIAVLFTLVFLAAWLVSPRLRSWVERPKYRFQQNVRAYDHGQTDRNILKERRTHP